MKVGVLSLMALKDSKDLPKFESAANALGDTIEFYNPNDMIIECDEKGVQLYNKSLNPIEVEGLVNWVPYAKYYELNTALKQLNIPVINKVDAVRNCRNKMLTTLILNKYGICQPDTVFIQKYKESTEKLMTTIGLPLVCKKKSGSRGVGSFKADSQSDLRKQLQAYGRTKEIYIQKYIENKGWDIRVIVVGSKVIGAMKKTAQIGEFRTHILHGGEAERFNVDDTISELSLKVVRALDLDFAGIDIMQGLDQKYYVLEVNSVPGIRIFNEIVGINFAVDILEYLHYKVKLVKYGT